MSPTNLELFLELHSNQKSINDPNYLIAYINKNYRTSFDHDALLERCRLFCLKLGIKWKSASKNKDYFLRKFDSWLKNSFKLSNPESEESDQDYYSCNEGPSSSFESLSERQKRRRTEFLRDKYSSHELLHAGKTKLNIDGDINSAKVVSVILETPEKSADIVDFCEGNQASKPTYSKEKSLAMYMSVGMTKAKYVALRNFSLVEDGHSQYPPYYQIQLAKSECYPAKSAISISETKVDVILQDLLDLTVTRLLKDWD